MRSLESIIRDVVEGKCCCEKKKKSLEHTIRDKVAEGRETQLAPSPTFQGNQFKHVNQLTGTINPPKKDGHVSKEGDDESAQRMRQKEKISQTHKVALEDVSVDEAAGALAARIGTPIAGAALTAGAGALIAKKPAAEVLNAAIAGASDKINKYANYFDTVTNASKDDIDRANAAIAASKAKSEAPPKQELKPSAPPPIMTQAQPKAPEKLSADRPAMPDIIPAAKPAAPTKPEEIKIATPAAKPITGKETAAAAPAAVKPATAAAPAIAKPVADAPAAVKPADIAKPATDTKTSDMASTAAKVGTAAAAATAVGTLAKSMFPRGMGIGAPSIQGKESHVGKEMHQFTAKSDTHFAKKHRAFEAVENTPRSGDRKTIEYVGRKEKVLARQAANKVNKIDESKLAGIVKNTVKEKKMEIGSVGGPTKEFKTPAGSTVVVNPPEKRSTLDTDRN